MKANVKSSLRVANDARDMELTLTRVARQDLVNKVVVAGHGRDALDYLHRRDKFSVRPHGNTVVVLLDLKLPKVHGLEVVKIIKPHELLKTVPVVTLSSARETPALKKCHRHGEEACAVKPVDSKDFMQSIQQLGLLGSAINEPPPDVPQNQSAILAREGEFMTSKEGARNNPFDSCIWKTIRTTHRS